MAGKVQPSCPIAADGGAAPSGDEAGQFLPTSLYVGDLDASVTDSDLFHLFNPVGGVVSLQVCRDSSLCSLGYGFVNFNNPVDAARALEALNFTPINSKPIRIMYSNLDPSTRRSGMANIFIKNLDKTIDSKALFKTFSSFGNIISCKVATDSSGQSKGYGFVQFDKEEAAQNAIEKLNGMLMNDKQVFVGPFLRKQERDIAANKTQFNNVYVKNLSESTREDDLIRFFGEFGNITSAVVMRDDDGKSKCFGFVNFENPEDAAQAVEGLNGKKFDDKEWYVGKAQKKSERELELKGRFEQSINEAVDNSQGVNLYIKNLDDGIGDDQLKELFSEFGSVTSCKVTRDPNGVSKRSGFVAFGTIDEASRALKEMNGKMVCGKALYVAVAQRKEERRARLQAQFSQMPPVAMAPPIVPRVPMYPPSPPGLGQQVFYGQAPPTLIPPQPGIGYHQQLVPRMRPGGAHMPNFFMPFVQQGQQPQQWGVKRTGVPPPRIQPPMPFLQQQMLPRGRVYQYPSGRNMPDVSMPGRMSSVPYDMECLPPRDAGMSRPFPAGVLATDLENASPDQQRTILGECLYPLVEQLEFDHAAKVTRMILELGQTGVLHLIESPEALKARVAEAMEILMTDAQQQQQQPNAPADQLAALSLSDDIVP